MGKVNHPLRLAIVDDYPVVVAGVASFLAIERINVIETGTMSPVIQMSISSSMTRSVR